VGLFITYGSARANNSRGHHCIFGLQYRVYCLLVDQSKFREVRVPLGDRPHGGAAGGGKRQRIRSLALAQAHHMSRAAKAPPGKVLGVPCCTARLQNGWT